jgi:hypothetical protein
LSNRFRFFGLSRSTRCGCCSYQVSSISVRRLTCYDHFCVFSVSYYYITPTVVGWCIAILRFFFTIILILILPHIFVRSISRRCLDQTLWNLIGIAYAMWSCAFVVPIKFHQFLFGE